MDNITNDPWFSCQKLNPDALARLFCLSFAGGGASFYRTWSKALPDTIEVCAIQLPGRETRMREKRLTDSSVLAKQIANAMLPYLDRPFALFGCSLGALLAFEVIRELRRQRQAEPLHLFVVSVRAPHAPVVHPAIADLPRDEFIEKINYYYQPDDEVWETPEILDIFLPVLRDDITIVDHYQYEDEPPLSCSIDVFAGANDRGTPLSSAGAWREQTSAGFELTIFNGGHFFFHQSLSEIQLKVRQRMNQLVSI